MLKRLSILILTVLMVVPAMAQPKESCECAFGPKKGQWEIALNFGQGQFFNDAAGLYYLLPAEDGTAVGVGANDNVLEIQNGLGNDHVSADLATYVLNTGSLNANSLVNIAGINAKYFFSDRVALSFGGAYNLNIQPQKDYIEGEKTSIGDLNVDHIDVSDITNQVGIGDIYSQKAVLAAVTNCVIGNLGVDFYFKVKNPRIQPYLGVLGQVKFARIKSYYPYTGQVVPMDVPAEDIAFEEAEMYRTNRAGQVLGFVGAINAGIDFAVTEGLIIGIQVAPVAYQYSVMHLQVMGQDPYLACNHNLSAFKYPQLKFGFRF